MLSNIGHSLFTGLVGARVRQSKIYIVVTNLVAAWGDAEAAKTSSQELYAVSSNRLKVRRFSEFVFRVCCTLK